MPDLDMVSCSRKFLRGGNMRLSLRTDSELLCSYTKDCVAFFCKCCNSNGTDCPCRSFCYENCTCFHDQNYGINVADCTSRGLTYLPSRRPVTVKHMHLDGNNLTSLEAEELKFPELTRLFLNKSSVSQIGVSAFRHLKKIKDIYLQHNDIREIKRSMFGNVSTLKQLLLHNNKIDRIESASFDNCTSLATLFLHNNNLESLDITLFDNLKALSKLTLHKNPWKCDCETGPDF